MPFVPQDKITASTTNFSLRVSDADFSRVKNAAAAANLSTAEFIRQAVFYAIDNMDAE